MRDNDGTRPLVPVLATALTLAGCGGSSAGDSTQSQSKPSAAPRSAAPRSAAPKKTPSRKPPGAHKASRATVAVITAWADTLRAGHPNQAAEYFDLPVLVQNAGPALRLDTREEVRSFNRTLPCGAHVVSTIAGRHYTVATFVLTERPGSPGCGATGQLAATAFVLRHGRISEWRRVLVPPPLGEERNVQPSGPVV